MRISSSRVERRQSLPRWVCRLWAGLECGMLAGAVTLAWFALHSLMRGEYWWSKFNLAAGWFYGVVVYHAGLGWVTLCGASVIILFYCAAGACYAWGWAAFFRTRAFVTTAFYVAAVYLLAAYFVWPSFGPFAPLWFPWTATVPAHFVLFATLVRYPELYIRLVNDFGDPAWLQRKQPDAHAERVEVHPPEATFEAPGHRSPPAEQPKD
jgi:hypothetical protein